MSYLQADLERHKKSCDFDPRNSEATSNDFISWSKTLEDIPHMTYTKRSLHPIRLGICAMRKKINSKPMRAILNHLNFSQKFDIIEFD